MTYSQPPANQPPANLVANLALFQFKTRDGSAPKPNSPVMTGSLQFSHEQLQQIVAWASTQQPDAYGKIRLSVSVWQEVSSQGQPYLKGNAKTPPPIVTSSMVQAAAPYQQQANQAVQNQVWPHVQAPQTPGLPAWNNQDAWKQQQQPSVPMPMVSVGSAPGSAPTDAMQPPTMPAQPPTPPVTQQELPVTQPTAVPTSAPQNDGNPPF